MTKLPKRLIRLEDGMEFLLNEETEMYRAHLGIPRLDGPKNIHFEYPFELLMETHRGKFKIADGTEDLAAMRKAWMDSVRGTDGHGDGDYD